MTAAETILLAVAALPDAGTSDFSSAAIAVAAWRLDPVRFGLADHQEQYPDHHRVVAELCKGRLKTWLTRNRPNRYYITTDGLRMASLLRDRTEWEKGREAI